MHGDPPSPHYMDVHPHQLFGNQVCGTTLDPSENSKRHARTNVVDLRAAEAYSVGVEGAITAEARGTGLGHVATPHPSWQAPRPSVRLLP